MKDILKLVSEFHEKFNVEKADRVGFLSEEEYKLRFKLMKEENYEYLVACDEQNIVEITDALGDQLYILAGTILRHGLQHKIVEVFEEIHRSNMSKLDAEGKPVYREDGKIIKSDLYSKPDLKSILEKRS